MEDNGLIEAVQVVITGQEYVSKLLENIDIGIWYIGTVWIPLILVLGLFWLVYVQFFGR